MGCDMKSGLCPEEVCYPRGATRMRAEDVFELVRGIRDPEFPQTLQELGVLSADRVAVAEAAGGGPVFVEIEIVPTIPHCSMASLIGLSVLWKATRSLSSLYVVRVKIQDGAHVQSAELNKQLADLERTESAFENEKILESILELAGGSDDHLFLEENVI